MCDSDETLEERLNKAKTSTELGKLGEDLAVRYLTAQGFCILDRNWRCKYGEADVVAEDEDGTICFIEVKTRHGEEAGLPEEAVTREKRKKYEKIALLYMIDKDLDDMVPVRFDAIAICIVNSAPRALLRHHKSAFSREM